MNPVSTIFGALKYMPATVARKALEKVNPKFGNYFSKAVSYGYDANAALDYLTDRFESEAQKTHKQQLEQGAAKNTLRPDEQVSRSELKNASIPGNIAKTGIGLAAGGLLGGLGESNQETPQAAPTPEEMLAEIHPDLPKDFQERLAKINDPIQVAAILYNQGKYSRPIKDFERKTKSRFTDLIEQIFGGSPQQQTQQPQAQPQQGQQQGNKDQFLQGINRLSQILQTLGK